MSAVNRPSILVRMLVPVRIDGPPPGSLSRAGALSTLGLLAQGTLRFATALLVGRIAGQAELGVVASAIAVATILALLWPTATGSAASKFLAKARGSDDHAEVRATAAHLRCRIIETTALLALVSVVVWLLLNGGSWFGALTVAALTLAYSGYSFTRGFQFGVGQVSRATAWDIASVGLGLAGLAGFLIAGVRGPALVLPLVLAYGVYAVAGWPYAVAGRPSRQGRRELDGFVALAAVGSLASSGFLQLSQIAALVVGGDVAAGQYASALNLATPASMLAASLSLVLLPSLAETWGRGDEDRFHAQTDRAMRAFSVVMVGIFGAIIVSSRALVEIIWGREFSRAADLLPVLVAAVLATNLGVVSVNALMSRSQQGMRIVTSASLGGMAVGITLWFLIGSRMGIDGVALGYLCGTTATAAVIIGAAWYSGGHAWGLLLGKVALGIVVLGAVAAGQRLAELPILFDPVLVAGFLLFWWLVNRAEVAGLPVPRVRRHR